jgi:hypothetical protein
MVRRLARLKVLQDQVRFGGITALVCRTCWHVSPQWLGEKPSFGNYVHSCLRSVAKPPQPVGPGGVIVGAFERVSGLSDRRAVNVADWTQQSW